MKLSTTTQMALLAAGVFALLIGYAVYQKYAPSPYDSFAECLTEQGAEMYGAYWCPNCIAQKDQFGSAWRHINYIECSTQGSQNFDLCPEIEAVPLWAGAGVEVPGRQSMEDLSELYDCELPA